VDFTLKTYRLLIKTLQKKGYSFYPFAGFLDNPCGKCVVLRHDVDRMPSNSLIFARLQNEAGIRGTYYFRIVPESWNEVIIKEISNLGHEIGYHYEDVSFTAARQKIKVKRQKSGRIIKSDLQDCKATGLQDDGRIEKELADTAIESFKKNLQSLRGIAPVKTICMHGSPLSRWDNRLLWKYYDYHEFGIIGEPYFDVDFSRVLYLTDTGRRWDGDSFSVRDKAQGTLPNAPRPPQFHSTFDIIHAAEEGKLPDKIMMTFHPQRWTDNIVQWMNELVWQNIKNIGKYIILKSNTN
jgi:hypothetical protein